MKHGNWVFNLVYMKLVVSLSSVKFELSFCWVIEMLLRRDGGSDSVLN